MTKCVHRECSRRSGCSRYLLGGVLAQSVRVVLGLLLVSGLLCLSAGCGFGRKAGGVADDLAVASGSVSAVPGAVSVEHCAGSGTVESWPLMPNGAPMSFASLAKAADPGVVTIKSRMADQGGRRLRHDDGFGMEFTHVGTGFVYDGAGLVLTNNHVIEGAAEIVVQFVGGRSVRATPKGADRRTDVAVLELVEKVGLSSLPLGDSDAAEVGDWVVAIGNPFGLSHTVSAGILSGKGRTKDDVRGLDPSGYFNFLQTDAAINEGNSGGPLLNLRGEVVGINTAIRREANSIGFAIPINMVKVLLPILVSEGKITRSAIGISVRDLDAAAAEHLNRPDTKGALIVSVLPGSGADRAGLRPDDVVVGFDGTPVDGPNALRWLASLAGVGKSVTVKVVRGSRTFDAKVVLGELPDQ